MISTSDSIDGIAARAGLLAFAFIAGLVLAVAFRDALSRYVRGLGPAIQRGLGRTNPPDWDRGDWLCRWCLSVNGRTAVRCLKCKTSRESAELPRPAPERGPDAIPRAIVVPLGALVVLEHNAAAHADALAGHWRLRVGREIVGSAAFRDGVVELLRSIEGADVVLFDPRGIGHRSYRLGDLASRFDRDEMPLDMPCPERSASH